MTAKLFTRKMVAEYFSVTPKTVRTWGSLGIIKPHCILNGRPRYSQANLDAITTDPVNPANHAK